MKLLYRFMVVTVGSFILFALGMVLTPSRALSSQTSRNLLLNTPSDYLEALQTADAFLWDWVNRDTDAGVKLMSTHLREEIGEKLLREFMSGLSDPHHQSFEIGKGQEVPPAQYIFQNVNSVRYIFPVVLYELYSGETTGLGYSGTIEIVRQGKKWRVDTLPRSSDNP